MSCPAIAMKTPKMAASASNDASHSLLSLIGGLDFYETATTWRGIYRAIFILRPVAYLEEEIISIESGISRCRIIYT